MIAPLPPGLTPGEYAPWFSCRTPAHPDFAFNTVGGRYLLLGFLPDGAEAREAAARALQAHRARFDDHHLAAFLVVSDPPTIAAAQNSLPGLRWFLDHDGAVTRLYGADAGMWFLIDPSMRILRIAPLAEADSVFAEAAALPPIDAHAGAPLLAPVLIVPRVFEPEFCRQLIALYDAEGGQISGVMRDVGGRTVGVLDSMKQRRDVVIQDPALRKQVVARIRRRLLPEIRRAFNFEVTRFERYLVACYDAQEGGYFRPHRDNDTLGTAHRRFAASINLNAEDFEGGDLRFPEFGQKTYRPPTGGAVVFGCALQHEATPVTAGRRYAFLPFLYDEAAAEVRQANMAALQPPSA
jgi:predicted 2-oxoglutarate/Fe(II)-dependent dioxygenase YbiX